MQLWGRLPCEGLSDAAGRADCTRTLKLCGALRGPVCGGGEGQGAGASFRLRTERNWRKTSPRPHRYIPPVKKKRVRRVYEHRTRSRDLFRALKMLLTKFSFRKPSTRDLGRTAWRTATGSHVGKADEDGAGTGGELTDHALEPIQPALRGTVQHSSGKHGPRAVLLGLERECSGRLASPCPVMGCGPKGFCDAHSRSSSSACSSGQQNTVPGTTGG